MVEVGVLFGHFSSLIIDTCDPRLLYMVDLWADQPRNEYADYREGFICQRMLDGVRKYFAKHLDSGVARILRGMSVEMADQIDDKSCDFIYLDADHSYKGCLADIKAYWPKLKEGGIMAGHDYDDIEWSKVEGKKFQRTDWGVVSAVNKFFDEDQIHLIELPTKNWWVKKMGDATSL